MAKAKPMSARQGIILIGAVVTITMLAQQNVRAFAKPAAPRMKAADTTPSPGKQVFDKWCAACHARGPGHPGTQSLEIKYKGELPAALEDRTDLSPRMTAVFVRQGVALMPQFRKTEISDADLNALENYLAKKK
jgi:mono/diheme cytochrome c family protein